MTKENSTSITKRRPSIFHYFRDRFFWLLDFDPTNVESGVEEPSLIRAIVHWLHGTFWTRKIEIGGVLFLCVIGFVCYCYVMVEPGQSPDLGWVQLPVLKWPK